MALEGKFFFSFPNGEESLLVRSFLFFATQRNSSKNSRWRVWASGTEKEHVHAVFNV